MDQPVGVLDPAADGQGGEHDGQVGFDGVAFAVVDGPGLQVALGHPERLLDLEQLVVGADHELRGDGGAVGAGPQVGDVALQPGQGAGFLLELPVDLSGAAGQLDEPVALDRGLPGDGLLGLVDLLVDAAQGPPGPVGPVLVVDDLVAAAAVRPGGPRLGEDVPVRDVLAGVLAPPLRDQVGDVRDPRAEDERQARRPRSAFWFASDTMPASATTVTSGQLVRGHERLDHRQHGLGLGLVALERADHEREPVLRR